MRDGDVTQCPILLRAHRTCRLIISGMLMKSPRMTFDILSLSSCSGAGRGSGMEVRQVELRGGSNCLQQELSMLIIPLYSAPPSRAARADLSAAPERSLPIPPSETRS